MGKRTNPSCTCFSAAGLVLRSPSKADMRSCFWADAAKDQAFSQACEEAGGIFVNAGPLARDPANAARSERSFTLNGVAGPPGDQGMKALAAIVQVVCSAASLPGRERQVPRELQVAANALLRGIHEQREPRQLAKCAHRPSCLYLQPPRCDRFPPSLRHPVIIGNHDVVMGSSQGIPLFQ
jgi:hypothetical protein